MEASPLQEPFAVGKHDAVAPTEIVAMRDAWVEAARKADVIVTVGARPVLADEHTWSPVLKPKAAVWFVGNEDEELSHFRSAVGTKRLKPVAEKISPGAHPLERLRLPGS